MKAFHKKESPLQGISGWGGGATGLRMSSAASKLYAEDVFSTYLYEETGTTVTVSNGVDMTKGGMVWFKNREATDPHVLIDTERGGTKVIRSNTDLAQTTNSGAITSFNNNGFAIGDFGSINGGSNKDVVSWSFREALGFFDVVTYTGNGSVRTISHSLGCIPGLIMIKCTSDGSTSWRVYHRAMGNGKGIKLDSTDGADTDSSFWNNTDPTSTEFTLGTNGFVNGNSSTFVAYLFAGGESTADTARSVDLDGSGDYFTTSTSSDYTFGTGDFTVEHWIKINGSTSGQPTLLDARTTGSYTTQWVNYINTDNTYNFYTFGVNRLVSTPLAIGTWNHVALVRYSGTTTLYLNGTSQGSYSDSNNYSNESIVIGCNALNFGHQTDGQFSNLRIVKGTALYTSSFRVPYEPLTNVTNTKLLCFNNSSTTGTTVGTITASGDPTASTDSPFDDPEGFKFGADENENMVKCGSYKGTGSSGLEINVGWEPSFLLWKETSGSGENWFIHDHMRGWDNKYLKPNSTGAESDSAVIKITSTGFIVESTDGARNHSGETYMYMVIRRPDGYVGKPAAAGTGVFAMDTGNSNADQAFTSGFPVDWAFYKKLGTTNNWYPHARITGKQYMFLNNDGAEQTNAWGVWDDMTGWAENTYYDSYFQSWMWKRHAGFDVVAYEGDGVNGRGIAHSMNDVPEMMIVKRRSSTEDWTVYHTGLNGGTNPYTRILTINSNGAEVDMSSTPEKVWKSTPTATHFEIGSHARVNTDGEDYLALLFSSIDSISKVGSYTGNGSTGQTITLGFQPRFVIIRKYNDAAHWLVLDTTRGWGSGDDKYLLLNSNAAQGDYEVGAPTSNGFTLVGDNDYNNSSSPYIYYAHA